MPHNPDNDIAAVHGKAQRTCFIVTPIGPDGSEIRRSTDGLIGSVIKPVLVDFDLVGVVAHEITTGGSISSQVISNVIEADLVIANLTGLNPNVMYELAIRHCVAKPLVVLAEKGTALPFDVLVERTVFFDNDMYGTLDLKPRLVTAIRAALAEPVDNPVVRVSKQKALAEVIVPGDESGLKQLMLQKLDYLESSIASLKVNSVERINTRSGLPVRYVIRVRGDGDSITAFTKALSLRFGAVSHEQMTGYEADQAEPSVAVYRIILHSEVPVGRGELENMAKAYGVDLMSRLRAPSDISE